MENKNTLHRLFFFAIVVAFTSSMAWSQGGTTLPKFNIFNDANLVLETEKLNDFDYKFKIVPKDQPDQAKTFVVMPLTQETFVNTFMKEMGEIGKSTSVKSSLTYYAQRVVDSIPLMKVEATNIFLYVQAAGITSTALSSEPLAGTLCLRNEIDVRQYLRINSKELHNKIDLYEVVRVRKNDVLANGRVISNRKIWEFRTQKSGKRKYGWKKIKFPEIPTSLENLAKYYSEERTFVLIDRPNAPTIAASDTGTQVFETFQVKAEALNRRDYLASKKLSEDLEKDIEAIKDSTRSNERKIETFLVSVKKQKDIIRDLDSVLLLHKRLVSRQDRLKMLMQEDIVEFNKKGKAIGYSMDDSCMVSINLYPNQEAKPMALEKYESENRFLKNMLESAIDQAKEYQKVLQKMIQNKEGGKSAISNLSEKEKETIISNNIHGFDYFVADDSVELVRQRILSSFKAMKLFDLRDHSDANDNFLKKNEVKFEFIRNLDLILEKVIETNRSMQKVKDSIESVRSVTEIKKLISQAQLSIDTTNDSIQLARNQVATYNNKIAKIQSVNPLLRFKIEYTTIEFNQGFIENIVVYGSIVGRSDEKIKFTNVMPIGFSRKKDFDDLANYDLWTEPTSNNDRSRYSMNLGDFFENYLQNLGLNRRDYSPADGAVKIDLEKGTCVELKKAPTYRLLEGKVFSDFVGLDEKSPNGLIQTEIGQKINLRTSRVGRYYRGKGGILGESKRLMYRSRSYVNRGHIGYIYPLLTLSKIENKNRSLLLDSRDRIVNNEYLQDRYISSMQLRNHEYLSAGCDLNLVTWDRPTLKSTLYFDLGFRFGRTQVIDSVRSVIDSIPQNNGKGSEFGVNTFRFYPKLILEIKPEERYGLNMSYAWNQYYLLHPTITQVAVPERYKAIGQNRLPSGYGTFELQAFFNPSVDNPTGKLFFRYSFNHQGLNLSTNFHQAQVGYSFFLLGRNKVRTQPD